MGQLKILCIHGIGGKEDTINIWGYEWRNALKNHLGITDDNDILFMKFDRFFKKYDAGFFDYVGFALNSFNIIEEKTIIKKWTDDYSDMVIEFYNEKALQQELRRELRQYLDDFQPNIIYAHSLGSLMCYNFFTEDEFRDNYPDLTLVTAGSQLGSEYLRNHIKYPIIRMPFKKWYNLNNGNDLVFASRDIVCDYDNFKQIETPFYEMFSENHDGLMYLNHEKAISEVWNSFR